MCLSFVTADELIHQNILLVEHCTKRCVFIREHHGVLQRKGFYDILLSLAREMFVLKSQISSLQKELTFILWKSSSIYIY